jgi:hypothetical protein
MPETIATRTPLARKLALLAAIARAEVPPVQFSTGKARPRTVSAPMLKALLLVLAEHEGEPVSLRYLAGVLASDVQWVAKVVAAGAVQGFLTRTKNAGHKTHRYTLNLDEIMRWRTREPTDLDLPPQKRAKKARRMAAGRATA